MKFRGIKGVKAPKLRRNDESDRDYRKRLVRHHERMLKKKFTR